MIGDHTVTCQKKSAWFNRAGEWDGWPPATRTRISGTKTRRPANWTKGQSSSHHTIRAPRCGADIAGCDNDRSVSPSTRRRSSPSVAVVVLAAGEGKRMKSAVPKVLHDICGRPALWHVVRAARAARPSSIVVVVGHDADEVEQAVRSWDMTPAPVFAVQSKQLGTGHA